MTYGGLSRKLARLEAQIGGGPCAMCAQRAANFAAEVKRELGPEWERGEAYPTEFNCPRCGAPFTIIMQVIQRKAEGVAA